ncbi:MAG: triose-phosphate isomerase, partial [Saprospiraceae bacterium]|nr:triose-phosphate isomerase [Saprospiraceae bacterium]
MRQNIAAGNWKMNLDLDEAQQLARDISNHLGMDSESTVILGVPYPFLKSISDLTYPITNLHIAAQNCHYEAGGAFTGEVSIPMLKSINIEHVIIGHSERREIFMEDNAVIRKKVTALINSSSNVIFCCGEPISVRLEEKQNEYVEKQLNESLFHLTSEDMKRVIIAYEPIWAIGTGHTASAEQAQQMHAYIRKLISNKYGSETAENTSILYGG